MTASAIGSGQQTASATATTMHENDSGAGWLIPLILLGIAAMLLFGWMSRSSALANTSGASVTQLVKTCPVGTIPANLLGTAPLEAGPIIVDE